MGDKNNGNPSFVEQMAARIAEHQIERIRRQERNEVKTGSIYLREQSAKQTLIELDNDMDASKV
jgi:hypothetical protein